MKTARTGIVLACLLVLAATAWAHDNAPMVQKFPSSHALVHYYCPDCPQAEKDHVAWCASIINHGDATTFKRLVPTHPEVKDLVNIKYRFVQYVQLLDFYGRPNAQGTADMQLLSQFAQANGYNEEDFYLHFSEPTRIDNLGTSMVYDGTKVTLTDRNGQGHVYNTSRAVAMVWGDFYYIFNWASEAWYQYIKYRIGLDFADLGGYSFNGLFEDVLNGPITDTFQGIQYGGRLVEFGNKLPSEITAQHIDNARIKAFQERINNDNWSKVFLPNSGNYLDAYAEQVMAVGDGTISESVNYPGSIFWKESWRVAQNMAANEDFYMISTYWDTVPSNYPVGVYGTARERTALHNAAWYWMAYVPGYVSFDVARACCDWSAQWPEVMESDIGSPTGAPYVVASGTLSSGWRWSLYAREYTKATVYFRGNNAWRDGNGGSVGLGSSTAATFSLPAGSLILRGNATWASAPAEITHYEAFGFVVKKDGAGDDDTADDDTSDDDTAGDDTSDDDTAGDDTSDDDTSDDDTADDDTSGDDTADDDTADDDAGDDDTAGDDDDGVVDPNMTFYYKAVGDCYLDNGLEEVAAAHGFTFTPVEFGPPTNCACDLRDYFVANPGEMTASVMAMSSYYCSNIWSEAEAGKTAGCYAELAGLAAANGADFFLIGPTPYAREEMEDHGWRSVAQRGADLFDLAEPLYDFLNANRILRETSPVLPYLDDQFQTAPYDSFPTAEGCRTVVDAIDAWLPIADGGGGDDDTGDDTSDDDTSEPPVGGDDDTSDDDTGDDDTDGDDTAPPPPDPGCAV
jgi:hypothetical protein